MAFAYLHKLHFTGFLSSKLFCLMGHMYDSFLQSGSLMEDINTLKLTQFPHGAMPTFLMMSLDGTGGPARDLS